MRILGIESSCDETGVAIYDETLGLVANVLHSQIALHSLHGGVVPELASRDHIKHLVSLVEESLKIAQISLSDIDLIAYTAGPGLIGALLVGASFAKSLAFACQIDALAVHHLEAHILAPALVSTDLKFPFLALLVSGGHTQLLLAKELGHYVCLGDTLDDALGEAFDKTAKLMGIPYPGGAELAAIADACTFTPYKFPRPMTDRPGLDFSFSGLKTHALTTWNKSAKTAQCRAEIAKAFQDAVIDTLVIKCTRAIEATGLKRLVVAGGVGANLALQNRLQEVMTKLGVGLEFPPPHLCSDNGAMVAYCGYLHAKQGKKDSTLAVNVAARWPLEE